MNIFHGYINGHFMGISPYIGLKNRPNIYGIGTSNQFRILEWPLIIVVSPFYILKSKMFTLW